MGKTKRPAALTRRQDVRDGRAVHRERSPPALRVRRLAVCSLGTGARHAAAFTVLRKGSWALYLGLARESADVEREESCKSTEFWGIGSGSGALFHAGRSQAWRGAVSFGCGDTLEMMLDCSVGALHVKKNGARLGSITERAWRWGRDSELRWALAAPVSHGCGRKQGAR